LQPAAERRGSPSPTLSPATQSSVASTMATDSRGSQESAPPPTPGRAASGASAQTDPLWPGSAEAAAAPHRSASEPAEAEARQLAASRRTEAAQTREATRRAARVERELERARRQRARLAAKLEAIKPLAAELAALAPSLGLGGRTELGNLLEGSTDEEDEAALEARPGRGGSVGALRPLGVSLEPWAPRAALYEVAERVWLAEGGLACKIEAARDADAAALAMQVG
jgi:hypothetical protein